MGMDDFICKYMGIVRIVAKRIFLNNYNYGFEYEDLVNEGVKGIYNAIRLFDFDKNISFQTFLEFKVRGAILDFIRSYNYLARTHYVKLKKDDKDIRIIFLGEYSIDELFKKEIIYDNFEDIVNKHINIEKINIILKKVINYYLTERQRKVIIKYYFENKTLLQISNELQINETTASFHRKKAINKLKKLLVYNSKGEMIFIKKRRK